MRDSGGIVRWLAALVLAGTLVACGARTELLDRDFGPRPQWGDAGLLGPPIGAARTPTDRVDLLVVIDNSGSMAEIQRKLMRWFETLFDVLRERICGSSTDPSVEPHLCDPAALANGSDVELGLPLRDLHVGVVSTDLGTPGFMVPGCDNTELGDDGRLNPIHFGPALQTHLPWAPDRPNAVTAPEDFRPRACEPNSAQFPSFIRYCSNVADPSCDRAERNGSSRDSALFSEWFRCHSSLFINGCGLEAQLESIWRALLSHDASDREGNTDPNAGFLRRDAVLGLLLFSDEEDGSVRHCANDQGFSRQYGARSICVDATDVYNTASPAWAHPTNPDLRFYLYQPGSRRDPTWNVDRYANALSAVASPRWSRDLWSLKPGRPDRIVFAAIAGVPLEIPQRDGRTNWDALLGAPARSRDDFYRRDSRTAIEGEQGEAGSFSMRQANMSPECSHVVPACRAEGSRFDPRRPCSNQQYQAFPSRRIVEVARRFSEDLRCGDAPCENGYVSSICARSYERAMREIGHKIARRMAGR
ncbi:MAG: hypothetical protein U0269_06825 [Polyangiales bacterium]